MSLSFRLVVLCAIAALPAAGIQLWSEFGLRRQRTAEVRAEAQRAALYAASEIDRIVGGARQLLSALGMAPSVFARENDRCSQYITNVEQQFPEYARLSVADVQGTLLCVSGEVPPGFGVAETAYFQEAVRTRRFVVGQYTVGRLSGRPVLPLALPILNADGGVDRVAIAAFDLAWLSVQLEARGVPSGGSVTVADGNGTIVARAPLAERFVGTRIPEDFLRLLHAAQPGVLDLVSQDGTRRLLGYVPVGHASQGLYVSAGLSAADAFAIVDQSTLTGLVLIAVGVLSAAIAAFVASRLFLGPPVRRLLQVMDHWRRGDTAARVGTIAGGSELTRLADGFDSMAVALEARAAALEESEERLRLATEAAGLGIWEVDIETGETRWSDELFILFGIDATVDGRVTRELTRSVVHQEDRRVVRAAWEEALESAKFLAEFRGLRRRPDGAVEERWFLSRGRLLTGRRGRLMRGVTLDITERRRDEERLVLLAREVDHRSKNALAVVQAALRLTPRDEVQAYASAVEGRVSALARAQTLLAADRWTGAELRVLLRGELAPFLGASQRVEIDGPPVFLRPAATQAIAMAIHELATNAVKHGALSVPNGTVLVSWEERDDVLRLRWVEAGGPAVAGPPVRRGFGSRVMDGTVRGQLGGRIAVFWERSGVICEMEVPLKHENADAVADAT